MLTLVVQFNSTHIFVSLLNMEVASCAQEKDKSCIKLTNLLIISTYIRIIVFLDTKGIDLPSIEPPRRKMDVKRLIRDKSTLAN